MDCRQTNRPKPSNRNKWPVASPKYWMSKAAFPNLLVSWYADAKWFWKKHAHHFKSVLASPNPQKQQHQPTPAHHERNPFCFLRRLLRRPHHVPSPKPDPYLPKPADVVGLRQCYVAHPTSKYRYFHRVGPCFDGRFTVRAILCVGLRVGRGGGGGAKSSSPCFHLA